MPIATLKVAEPGRSEPNAAEPSGGTGASGAGAFGASVAGAVAFGASGASGAPGPPDVRGGCGAGIAPPGSPSSSARIGGPLRSASAKPTIARPSATKVGTAALRRPRPRDTSTSASIADGSVSTSRSTTSRSGRYRATCASQRFASAQCGQPSRT